MTNKSELKSLVQSVDQMENFDMNQHNEQKSLCITILTPGSML